jgi:hypothetical protein
MRPRLAVLTFTLAAVTALIVGGCKDAALPASSPDAARTVAPPTPTPTPTPDAAAAPRSVVDAAVAKAETPPGPGKLGVPSCDEYLDKMTKCIAHLSVDAQGPMRDGLEESRKAWQSNAQTPEGKKALEPTCKQALEVAKSAAAAMGCEW